MTIRKPFRVVLIGAILILANSCSDTPVTADDKQSNVPETIGQTFEKLEIDLADEESISKSLPALAHRGVRNRSYRLIDTAFLDDVPKEYRPNPPYPTLSARPRWKRKDINVYVAPELIDIENLRTTAQSIFDATGLNLNFVEGEPSQNDDKEGIYIDPFGYIVLVEISAKLYTTEDERQSISISDYYNGNFEPPSIAYCRLANHIPFETAARCLSYAQTTSRFHEIFGHAKVFWADSVVFRPIESIGVDGFYSTTQSGNIYFSQCWIPKPQKVEVRQALAQECLLRSLGFANEYVPKPESVLSGPHRYNECQTSQSRACADDIEKYGRIMMLTPFAEFYASKNKILKTDIELLENLYLEK